MYYPRYVYLHPILLTLFLGTTVLSAQQQEIVSVRFTALSLDSPVNNLYFDSDGEAQMIWTSTVTRSTPKEYTGPPQLVFYVREAGAEEQTIKRPVAAANLTGYSGKEVLLLFAENKQEVGRYNVHVLDDSLSRAPENSWRMFNLSPTAVAVKVGEEDPVTIKQRAEHLFRFSSDDEASVVIQIAASTQDGWQLARRSTWSHGPNVRTIVFLLPGKTERSIRVKTINQSLHTTQQTN